MKHRHKLTLTTTETDTAWSQVAAAGEFHGYAGGSRSFTFDEHTFRQLVANFRKHPAYRGGSSDVIPWDFHHASEMSACEGSVPTSGAPAQGWVQELEIRHTPQGQAELWALTRWLEPAKTYIKEGRYSWASVSVVFDSVDPRTGRVVGPVLTSVALTNQPFIEGMQKLAASKQQKGNTPMKTIRCKAVPDNSTLPELDVSAHTAGRNATERLVLHVKATHPNLTNDAAFVEAMRLKRTHRVIA